MSDLLSQAFPGEHDTEYGDKWASWQPQTNHHTSPEDINYDCWPWDEMSEQ